MDRNNFLKLFRAHFRLEAENIRPIAESGSHRMYFRIRNSRYNCIGVYSPDIAENRAFLSFTKTFRQGGLNVPEVLAVNESQEYYLLEDLGDQSFHDLVMINGFEENPDFLEEWYRKILDELIRFQVDVGPGLDYSLCVPRDSFDRQSVLWDLYHFKYFFLKISGLPFNEQLLEDDFQLFAQMIDRVDRNYFMYRDFQSRNIMIHDGNLFFIDYQGGRKGALQYDLASLLFEAKTHLPFDLREKLLFYYIEKLSGKIKINRETFIEDYYHFVLIRVLQALGAYGLRGLIEKKALFLQSIPYALKNLRWLIENGRLPENFKELTGVLDALSKSENFDIIPPPEGQKLQLSIQSFSYRKSLPYDLTGNGGGFIFDCRALENPGKIPELKEFTGKDQVIRDFLLQKSDIIPFMQEVDAIVSRSIEKYIQSGFKHLQVNFGCTGGRHRSVFAAEKLAEMLDGRFDIDIHVKHRELKQ